MKQGLKFGFYLGGVLILSTLFYYFFYPTSMFATFGKAMIMEILLYALFMFFAISKSSETTVDSGTFFKIAFLTLAIGFITTSIFRMGFSNYFSDALNPIYLEAMQADINGSGNFFGRDPLETFEQVALLDKTIEEEITLENYFLSGLVTVLLLGIPFTILVSYVSRRILNFRKG